MFDPKSSEIAVALMKDSERQVVLVWNENWGAFVFPMTKLDAGPPVETPEKGAVRAASDAVRLPTRAAGGAGHSLRKLQFSPSAGELKEYQFNVVRVEIHPDFPSGPLPPGCIHAPIDKLLAGEYQPLSPSVQPILESCLEWGWL